MRRLLAALGIAASVLAPALASAQDLWKLEKFRSDISVGRDGVVEVRETIDAEFLAQRHGIYRYVPYQGKNVAGGTYRLDIDLVSVTRDGEPEPYQESRDGRDVIWKIGDAARTMTGAHEYVITYDVTGALGAFATYDEIYWNATGDGWDVPLPAGAAAVVMLPEGVAVTQSACYTGPSGSTAKDCEIIAAPSQVGFVTKAPDEPLTVAVGFPKGSVPILQPTPVRVNGAGPTFPPPPTGPLLNWILPALALFAAFVWLFLLWRRKGVDAKFPSIVAQYEPPEGLRPAEIPCLLRQGGGTLDVASTIIDLAVRGYVRIEETTSGFFAEKDYRLHLIASLPEGPALKEYERAILLGIFGKEAAPAEALVSELRMTGFPAKIYAASRQLKKGLEAEGYLDAAADKTRGSMVLVGGIIAVSAAFLSGPLSALGAGWMYAGFGIGVMTCLFGAAMAKWTEKGHDAAWRAKGYKEFISKVEKYRAPWMETQDIFEKTLPYAMAFGLGKKWAKAFAGLQMERPEWYQSGGTGAWSALALHEGLRGFSGSMATSSGTSGSGGGGHSGGGGGGGGGGSW